MMRRRSAGCRAVSGLSLVAFVATSVMTDLGRLSTAHAAEANMPRPVQMVTVSAEHEMPLLKGIEFDPANPLHIEFLVEPGSSADVSNEEAAKLIRYFLSALTVPEQDLWVNLSPYESDRIIDNELATTELGQDMLAQDYMLKQLAASLTHPDTETGKAYWSSGAGEALSKVWITPDAIEVYEGDNAAYVTKATLKVMTEADYFAMQKAADTGRDVARYVSTDGAMSSILPAIEKDVNAGKNFASLRQVYNALILGCWFKKKFRESFYSFYFDSEKMAGVDTADPQDKEKIYEMYVEAFKHGVYDLVKKEYDASGRAVKRQYFSGGVTATNISENMVSVTGSSLTAARAIMFSTDGMPVKAGSALTTEQISAHIGKFYKLEGSQISDVYETNQMRVHDQGHYRAVEPLPTIAREGTMSLTLGISPDGEQNALIDAGEIVSLDEVAKLASIPYVQYTCVNNAGEPETKKAMLSSVKLRDRNIPSLPELWRYFFPAIDPEKVSLSVAVPQSESSYALDNGMTVTRRYVSQLFSQKDQHLPAGVEEYVFTNTTGEDQEMTVVVPQPNYCAMVSKRVRPTQQDWTFYSELAGEGQVHTAFKRDGLIGVEMSNSRSPDEKMTIAVPTSVSGADITVATQEYFNLSGYSSDLVLNQDGAAFHHENKNEPGNEYGAAVLVKVKVKAGATVNVPIVRGFDFTTQKYKDGVTYERPYVREFADVAAGLRAQVISDRALSNYTEWQSRMIRVQEAILAAVKAGPAYAGDEQAAVRKARLIFNDLGYLLSNASLVTYNGKMQLVARFLECFDYPFNNSADVDVYSDLLLAVFPGIELEICQEFIDSIDKEDPKMAWRNKYYDDAVARSQYEEELAKSGKAEGSDVHVLAQGKRKGSVYHDLGRMPGGHPLRNKSEYSWYNTDYWIDLFPKLALRVLRDAVYTGNKDFITDNWDKLQRGFDYLMKLDTDGDGVPDGQAGQVRNTFDNIPFAGADAYDTNLFIAACHAMKRMAELAVKGQDVIKKYEAHIAAAEKVYENLWTVHERSDGTVLEYYKSCAQDASKDGKRTDTDVMTDQLWGLWYWIGMGEEPFMNEDRVRKTLLTIYKNNKTTMGWANLRKQDGTAADSDQGKDIWIASNYVFAQLLEFYGLTEQSAEVYKIMDKISYEHGGTFATKESVRPEYEQEEGETEPLPHQIVANYPRSGAILRAMVLARIMEYRKENPKVDRVPVVIMQGIYRSIFNSEYAQAASSIGLVVEKVASTGFVKGGVDLDGMSDQITAAAGSSSIAVDPRTFEHVAGLTFTIRSRSDIESVRAYLTGAGHNG